MKKKYIVNLSGGEKKKLRDIVKKGVSPARKIIRARTLLLSDKGLIDRKIAKSLDIGHATVERTRIKYFNEGLKAALEERPRPGGKKKLNGHQEACLVALACEEPPEGRIHWTMQLLADRLIKMEVVDTISDETVRRTLKKMKLNPGKKSSGA